MGEITPGGTLFLLIAGSALGAMGGIAYMAIRSLLPGRTWVKGLLFGVLLLALAGSFLVASDNPDFVVLTPEGLAVAMFAALPVLYGLLFVPLAERLEPMIRPRPPPRPDHRSGCWRVWCRSSLAGGLGPIVIAGAAMVWAIW